MNPWSCHVCGGRRLRWSTLAGAFYAGLCWGIICGCLLASAFVKWAA